MLQVVLGFDAATVASAFLVAPATMGQRLSRAKAKIRQAGISFEVPERDALRERLDAVLEAIYAAFAEGWSDPQGVDPHRRNLAEEAIWLGRLVAALLPEESEALGLLSLMLHAHARREARRGASGHYVPLAEQDPARWDAAMIDEAEALLSRANRGGVGGRYQLEAAVQSAHAARRESGKTDWAAILQLYDALLEAMAGLHPHRRFTFFFKNGLRWNVNGVGNSFDGNFHIGQQAGTQQDLQLGIFLRWSRQLGALTFLFGPDFGGESGTGHLHEVHVGRSARSRCGRGHGGRTAGINGRHRSRPGAGRWFRSRRLRRENL